MAHYTDNDSSEEDIQTGEGSYDPSEHDLALNDTQQDMVAAFQDAGINYMKNGQAVTGMAALHLSECVRELILLRKHRNDAYIEFGDAETTETLNEAIRDLHRDLKRTVPYHPAFGSEVYWESLGIPQHKADEDDIEDDGVTILDPAIRDYDWDQFDL